MMKSCAGRFPMQVLVPFLFSIFQCRELQDVAAQILVLDDVRKLLGNVGGVNLHVFLLEVGRFERDFVQNFFEDGVEAAGADVFCLLIHVSGKAGDSGDSVFRDVKLDAFGFQQRDVLLDERILGLGQDANKIFFLQGLQFDANGQAALKFRD